MTRLLQSAAMPLSLPLRFRDVAVESRKGQSHHLLLSTSRLRNGFAASAPRAFASSKDVLRSLIVIYT